MLYTPGLVLGLVLAAGNSLWGEESKNVDLYLHKQTPAAGVNDCIWPRGWEEGEGEHSQGVSLCTTLIVGPSGHSV